MNIILGGKQLNILYQNITLDELSNKEYLKEKMKPNFKLFEQKIKTAKNLEQLEEIRKEMRKEFRKSSWERGYLKRKIILKGMDIIHGGENIFVAMEYSDHRLTLKEADGILKNVESNHDVNMMLKLADYYHYCYEQTGEFTYENVWLEVYTSMVAFPKVTKKRLNETTKNIRKILANA